MKNIAHTKWKMEKTCHAINCVFFQVGPSTKCFELNGHQITPKKNWFHQGGAINMGLCHE
jgi:hypothetical protein